MIYKKLSFFIFSFLIILACFNGVLNQSSILGKNIDLPNITEQMVNYMNERNIDWKNIEYLENRDFKQRFKYRWPFKTFEKKFYDFSYNIDNLTNKHAALIYYSIIIFLGFIFTLKSSVILLNIERENFKYFFLILFLCLYLFIEIVSSMSETFSYVEFLCISICIFGSIKKNLYIFYIGLVLSIFNRESGIAYGILYPLINYKSLKTYITIIIVISGPFIFALLNYDIIEFFPYFIFFGGLEERPTFMNLKSIFLLKKGELINSLLIYLIFFVPLFYMNIKNYFNLNLIWPLSVLFVLFFIIIIGSFFGNFRVLLLFIPLYLISFTLFLNNSNLFNKT